MLLSLAMKQLFPWLTVGLLAISLLWFGGESTRLLAFPLLIIVMLRLRDQVPARIWSRLPKKCWSLAAPALLLAVTLVLYGRLLLGDFPINHDHPVMLFRAWNTGSQMLSHSSLTGFSTMMFAGYPANELYPIGTDLLVCGVRALFLGTISWETAYCWALFLAVLAYPAALYALGHRHGGIWTGLVAGMLGLVDRGAWMQSGWAFNLDWGVWSMGLGFSLCLWTLWFLDRLLHRPGVLTLVATAFCIAGAILCHPMSVAILAFALPMYLLTQSLSGQLAAPGLWMPRVVSAGLLGFGLCAFWLLPFVLRQQWFEPLAYPWHTFDTVLHGLLDGRVLASFGPIFLIGGLLGLGLGARQQKPFFIFLLLSSGLLLFFSSRTFLLVFDIIEKLPAIAHLQLERFSYFIRSAMLLGCGFLVQLLLRRSQTPQALSGFRRHGLRLIWVAMATPFLFTTFQAGPYPFFAPAKPLSWSSSAKAYRDLQSAAAALNAMDRAELGRIVVSAPKHDHLLVSLPVYTGLPIFKLGFTPENNYRYKFESRDLAVWKAIGVSHVLASRAMPRTGLTFLQRFGHLWLYRFDAFDPSPVSLQGPGQAVVSRNEAEILDVHLTGTNSTSKLMIHRGHYARWEASLDGTLLAMEGASIGDSPAGFIRVAAQDGSFRLRYRWRSADWLGNSLSWLAWLVLALLLASRCWPPLRKALLGVFGRWKQPISDAVTLGTLAATLACFAFLVLRLMLPSATHFAERSTIADITDLLPRARAEVIRPNRTEACRAFDGHKLSCPGPAWNYAGKQIIVSDHQLRQCIWMHPIQGAKFALHFDEVALGDHIQGFFGIDDAAVEPPSKHEVHLTVLLDDHELGRFTCPSRRGWFPWQVPTPERTHSLGKITFQVDAPFTGRRHFCFTAFTTQASNQESL